MRNRSHGSHLRDHRRAYGRHRARHPAGEIDLAVEAELAAVLDSLPDQGAVILDMSAVTFMDLTGLRFLLDLRRLTARHGSTLVATGWHRQPLRLLAACGVGACEPAAPSDGAAGAGGGPWHGGARPTGRPGSRRRYLGAPRPPEPFAGPEWEVGRGNRMIW
ncbi:STAS domain-containing protein [Streptomyces cirratus]